MDDLVNFIAQIREFVTSTNIKLKVQLPQIIVIGEQSSGKSSVLEGIVGREFLPKGSGIVTKRPLVVNLCQIQSTIEYASFAHLENRSFSNFDEVMKVIEEETKLVVGGTLKIFDKPIFLKIYSSRFPNLTLVDLPGLTQVPIGNQPVTISEQIRCIVSEYCKNPNSLILAILPAITDVTNSDALKLARQFDPLLTRTIGVLTKLDMMDMGTNALPVLENNIIKLEKGWVGVVNRSQKDIENHVQMAEFLEKEEIFFKVHPNYRRISSKCGIKYLRKLLHETLKQHVRNFFPDILKAINFAIESCASKIREIESKSLVTLDISSGEDIKYFMTLIHQFQEKMNENLGISQETVDLNALSLGANLNNILMHSFLSEFWKIKCFDDLDKKIQIGIENACAVPGSIHIPDSITKSICRGMIETMRSCALHVVGTIKNIINQCILSSLDKDSFFPILNNLITYHVSHQLNLIFSETQSSINFLIEIEKNHINFRHPDFLNNDSPGNHKFSTDGKLKGYVEIDNKKFKNKSKRAFIVLNKLNLIITKDFYEKEVMGVVSLIDCTLESKEYDSQFFFSLYPLNKKFIFKDFKHLDIRFENLETMKNWLNKINSILNAKNVLENSVDNNFTTSTLQLTDAMNVHYIRYSVEKYVKVILKNTHDHVIKVCHHNFVNKLMLYIRSHLPVQILHCDKLRDALKLDYTKKKEIVTLYSQKEKLSKFAEKLKQFVIT